MTLTPMEQFEVTPLVAQPLFHIGSHPIYFTNQSLLMVVVVIAASLFLTLAVKPGRLVPTRGQSMAEASYEFVANMIHSATGEDGLKYFPFIFTLFMFVLFCNFFGMIPWSFTVTSQIAVTFALAAFVVLMVIVVGFMKGWEALRVLSPDTCRPFSRGRAGLVIGEGAATIVLEELEHAQARGAVIHAEVAGFGTNSDGSHATQPSPATMAATTALCSVLETAKPPPS